jgi:hypothetical protein
MYVCICCVLYDAYIHIGACACCSSQITGSTPTFPSSIPHTTSSTIAIVHHSATSCSKHPFNTDSAIGPITGRVISTYVATQNILDTHLETQALDAPLSIFICNGGSKEPRKGSMPVKNMYSIAKVPTYPAWGELWADGCVHSPPLWTTHAEVVVLALHRAASQARSDQGVWA